MYPQSGPVPTLPYSLDFDPEQRFRYAQSSTALHPTFSDNSRYNNVGEPSSATQYPALRQNYHGLPDLSNSQPRSRFEGTSSTQQYAYSEVHPTLDRPEYYVNPAQLSASQIPSQLPVVHDNTLSKIESQLDQADHPSSGDAPAKKPAGRRRKMPQDMASSTIVPLQYVPDPNLATPEECLDMLYALKRYDAQSVRPAVDDWEAVKASQSDHYVGLIYCALLEAPDRVPFYGPQLNEEQQDDYEDQQKIAHATLAGRLQDPIDRLRAKAQCSLLFHEALMIHEAGVGPGVYQAVVEEESTKKRNATIPKVLDRQTCSTRLNMIVKAVQSNKLVAADVVDGLHFDKIAMSPRSYARSKASFQKSNFVRQKNLDNRRATEAASLKDPQQAGVVSKKRKTSDLQGEDESVEQRDVLGADDAEDVIRANDSVGEYKRSSRVTPTAEKTMKKAKCA
jgi:hypothetical protein